MLSYTFLATIESTQLQLRFKMISQNIKNENALCICPECKNSVDLSRYPNIAPGMVIECNHCGMTLLVKGISNGNIKTEIVDEGK